MVVDNEIKMRGEYSIDINDIQVLGYSNNLITTKGFEEFVRSSPTAFNGKNFRDVLSKVSVGSGTSDAALTDVSLENDLILIFDRKEVNISHNPTLSIINVQFESCVQVDAGVINEIGITSDTGVLVSRIKLSNLIKFEANDKITIKYRLNILRPSKSYDSSSLALYKAFDILGVEDEEFSIPSTQVANTTSGTFNVLRGTIFPTDYPHEDKLLGKVDILLGKLNDYEPTTYTHGPGNSYRLNKTDRDRLLKQSAEWDGDNTTLSMVYKTRRRALLINVDSLIFISDSISHKRVNFGGYIPFSVLKYNNVDLSQYVRNFNYKAVEMKVVVNFRFINY